MSKQSKPNLNNEKIKRVYFNWLENADGKSQSTVDNIGKSILIWDRYTNFEDYTIFNKEKIKKFKDQLITKKSSRNGETISAKTCYHHLRHLRDFFSWLSNQKGYKSKIVPATDIRYFELDRHHKEIALTKKIRNYPSLEQIKQVVGGINVQNEIGLRDRALICFTLLTGMRDSAIISLPIKSFDIKTHIIDQDPMLGVKTKFSKTNKPILLNIDRDMVDIVLNWVRFLMEKKGFSGEKPLFPASKLEHTQHSQHCFSATKVSDIFWTNAGPMRKIFKKHFENVGIDYFPPHSLRKLAVIECLANSSTNAELVAIRQQFGHEALATTFEYGHTRPEINYDTLKNIDFSGKKKNDVEIKKAVEKIKDIFLSTEK